ncbi:helix-hairpin-helix domain-containing protein [Bacillus sp. CGMCC 1.16541]|uniref:helix-hairpin-helix domain-containing protein n=1 Tax=Bacillus sp. CGMCC 1.16541 TaxID=2185143 RepID=UPI001EF6777F|nr:helix-hairpin-helix domain-containing protein [Bacillus sp. CGMCC 1.16541]
MLGDTKEPVAELPEQPKVADVPSTIIVDVKGAVKVPGVYELEAESRVQDVIMSAGGLLESADSKQINFAMKLQDEMVVYVPIEGEVTDTPVLTTNVVESHSNDQSKLININTATEQELQTLNGIGPSKAASIVSYREENGLFKSIEELTNVSGIGEKSFEQLKDQVTVN